MTAVQHEWVVKQGREVHQAKHYCPEPTHAWPKPGAYWFDLAIDAEYLRCPDCSDVAPITRAYTIPLGHGYCKACSASDRAPDCLRCEKCRDKGE